MHTRAKSRTIVHVAREQYTVPSLFLSFYTSNCNTKLYARACTLGEGLKIAAAYNCKTMRFDV